MAGRRGSEAAYRQEEDLADRLFCVVEQGCALLVRRALRCRFAQAVGLLRYEVDAEPLEAGS